MSTKAITEKPEERQMPADLPPRRDTTPSVVRDDDLGLPRFIGIAGAMLTIFGGMALGFHLWGRPVQLSRGLSIICVALGIGGLLFHAAFDRDVQFRRLYGMIGGALLVVGAALLIYSSVGKDPGMAGRFSVPVLVLSLLFVLSFLRNETDPPVRQMVQYALGGAGALMIVIGLGGGNVRGEFLLPAGLVLALLGLVYVAAFVGSRGIADDLAYRAALGLAAVGALVILVALVRSFLPSSTVSYFKTYGFLLMVVGFLYLGVSALLAAESPVAVLTRRELGAFFYSPMAYLTLIGFGLVTALPYGLFLNTLFSDRAMAEPIVRNYAVSWFAVIPVMVVVPVLTMRLLSEEYRSGTLEVLMTAPVSEATVVLSKFLGALISYLVVWLPFWLYLLAIPLAGGSPFDYRPLVSFLIAVIVTGGAFVSMGLFFSSLTRNQIASFMPTFAGILMMLVFYILPRGVIDASRTNWVALLKHMSYIDLWDSTLEGKLVPRMLLFPLSLNVFFLFLTVKVLESRKWR